MSNSTAATAQETTPLLSSTSQDSSEAAGGRQTWVEPSTKRALIAVFVANLMVSFAHYVAISSIMDLIRGLSCKEYYSLQVRQPNASWIQRDCNLVEIQDRTSTVFSYMLSINSFISCLSALWLAPYLLRRIGLRLTMIIAVLVPTAELFVLASVPNRFPSTHGWIDSPTAALRFLLLESLLFGVVGCPDTLIGIVSQSIVLDVAPPPLRSTWLARLSSCTFLGMLASTLLLNTLSLDTSRDDISDKLPILLGAFISTAALVFTCVALPIDLSTGVARQEAIPQASSAQEVRPTAMGLKARLGQAMQPLRLLLPIQIYDEPQDRAQPHAPSKPIRDWRLTKLIIAATLCDQIAVTTNLQVIYVQTIFGLHAQQLSRILGFVGLMKWVYLVLVFPRIAESVRRRYRAAASAPTESSSVHLQSAAAAADRLLAVLSMLFDVLAWAVVIVGGRVLNYPTYLLGLVLYALAAANVSSITSLASILLPRNISTDSLVATMSSLANIMSTVGPILNANLYRFGLKRGFPEIVFAMAAAISVAVAVLVAQTRLPVSPLVPVSSRG